MVLIESFTTEAPIEISLVVVCATDLDDRFFGVRRSSFHGAMKTNGRLESAESLRAVLWSE